MAVYFLDADLVVVLDFHLISSDLKGRGSSGQEKIAKRRASSFLSLRYLWVEFLQGYWFYVVHLVTGSGIMLDSEEAVSSAEAERGSVDLGIWVDLLLVWMHLDRREWFNSHSPHHQGHLQWLQILIQASWPSNRQEFLCHIDNKCLQS